MKTVPFHARQREFRGLEKLLGSCSEVGSWKKCPSQFRLLISHPLSIWLSGIFGKRLLWRASAGGHGSPAKLSALTAGAGSSTVAFGREKGSKAVNRGLKQLIQGFEQRVRVRKPNMLWREALLEALHYKECCFAFLSFQKCHCCVTWIAAGCPVSNIFEKTGKFCFRVCKTTKETCHCRQASTIPLNTWEALAAAVLSLEPLHSLSNWKHDKTFWVNAETFMISWGEKKFQIV